MACDLNPPCVLRAPRPLSAYPTPEYGDRALGKKAAANRALGKVWLDREFFPKIPDPADRLVLIAHEFGHLDGAECEGCADTQAGRLIKSWKLDGEAAADTLQRVLEHRDADRAHDNLLQGYYGADDPTKAVRIDMDLRKWHDREHALKDAGLRFEGRRSCPPLTHCVRDGLVLAADAGASGAEYPPRGSRGWWALAYRGGRPPFRVVGGQIRDRHGRAMGPAGLGAAADAAFDPKAIAAELLAKAPTTGQTFATTEGPTDSLAGIDADQSVQWFPDDARRYAWVLFGIANHEAYKGAGGYDPLSVNYNYGDGKKPGAYGGGAGTLPDPSRTVRSTDYGLMQVNDRAWPQLLNQNRDGTAASSGVGDGWQDARVNVGQGAQVLASARAALPNSLRDQINAYGKGVGAVKAGKSVLAAYVTSDGPTVIGKDYAQDVFDFLRNNYGIDVENGTDWGPPASSDSPVANAASDIVSAVSDALSAPFSPSPTSASGSSRTRDLSWGVYLVVLLVAGAAVLFWAADVRRRHLEAA